MTTQHVSKRKKTMAIIGILMVVLVVVALWNQPIYRRYSVSSDKVKESFRIVHLSDLHSSTYGKDQSRLLKKIRSQEPDIIVMTGDMVDDHFDEEGAFALMEGLLDYPLFYVSGNHEGWHDDTEGVFKAIEELGVTCFFNDSAEIEVNGNTINLGGIMDPAGTGNTRRNVKKKFRRPDEDKYTVLSVPDEIEVSGLLERDEDNYTILLSHRPEYIKTYRQYPLDMVLCGHAHGGQVRIPFLLNGLYAPNQGFFPENAGGHYVEGELDFIVSRGLSIYLWIPRVFNPPEVVVIDVEGE